MDLTQLFELFSDPAQITQLGTGAKLTAALITTLLGMGITFTALIVLMFAITWMNKIMHRPEPVAARKPVPVTMAEGVPTAVPAAEMDEVIAAITAALNLYIQPPRNQVVIRNIRRVKDFQPRWSQAGLYNQMDRNI